jgi:protein-disulfide isomerase
MEKMTKKEKKELRRQEMAQKQTEQQKQNSFKKFGIWIGGAIVLILIIWGVVAATSNAPKNQTPTAPAITSADISTGSANAKANLIEYADFECPACATNAKYVEQLEAAYPKDLRVGFRFFPLPQHQYGMTTAQVAFAANKQDKFWEMYKLLFDNQATWAASSNGQTFFDNYAKQLNLDINKFHQDENAQATKDFINNDFTKGEDIGINSTPTFYLNGNLIQPDNYEAFKSLVDNEIKAK